MLRVLWRWAPLPVKAQMLRWLCGRYGLCVDTSVIGWGTWSNGRWTFDGISFNSEWDEAEAFIMTHAMESMWTKR